MQPTKLERLLMLYLKYPTAQNIAIAKQILVAINNDKVAK
jgi:hypothetical protein